MSKRLPEFGALDWKTPRWVFRQYGDDIAELAWHRAYEVPEKTRAGRSPGDIAENFTLGALGEVICKHVLQELDYDVGDLDFKIQSGTFEHRRDLYVDGVGIEVKTARVVDDAVSHIIPANALKRFDALPDDTPMMFVSIRDGIWWNGESYDIDRLVSGSTTWLPKYEAIKTLAEPYASNMKRDGFKAIYYNDPYRHGDIMRMFASRDITLPPCP